MKQTITMSLSKVSTDMNIIRRLGLRYTVQDVVTGLAVAIIPPLLVAGILILMSR